MTERVTPGRIDPRELVGLLLGAGWVTVGGRADLYERIRPPGDEGGPFPRAASLVIPLDRTAPDYTDLMEAALRELGVLLARQDQKVIFDALGGEVILAGRGATRTRMAY